MGVSDSPRSTSTASEFTLRCGIAARPHSAKRPSLEETEFSFKVLFGHRADRISKPASRAGTVMAGDYQRLSEGKPHADRGPSRKSHKKLQVIICVLLVELCERFTFFGIVCNMILFCTVKLGYDNYLAATVNLSFIGASTLTPVLVGWFAETCLGKTKVLYLCAFLHFFGMSMDCIF